MHVRVRILGRQDTIVVVESKLTKIDQFRRVIHDKFDVDIKSQRLFYGGKLLENGYTFHDYNIKLNDVIQLMVRTLPLEESTDNESMEKEKYSKKEDTNGSDVVYEDAASQLYAIGDLIDMRDREQGAWFEGKVDRIVYDPAYMKPDETKTDNKNDLDTQTSSSKNIENGSKSSKLKIKEIADYFNKIEILSTRSRLLDREQMKKEGSDGLLYKIILEADGPGTPYYCKLKEIRPRARREIEVTDLTTGQVVMINHNTEAPSEKGNWYDFKVDEVKKLRTSHELVGTLYLGPEAVPQDDTKVKVHDKIYAIEAVIPLAERTKQYKTVMVTPTEMRSSPLNCSTCRDDEHTQCKECGCFICSGKEAPEKIVLCDECNKGYHMYCLSPPLSELPEEDWYCPSCKRDTNTVVAPGAAKQTKKTTASKTTRDWGRGMACVGKTKTCAMPINHFGPVPGIMVGMCWKFRIQLSESGVHRPPVSGIHGRDVEGAYSIVLSGGYEDDYDNGDEFTYTGSGGRDLSGNKRTAEQSCDQTLTRENKALARNCAVKQVSEQGGDAGDKWREGKPVRVVRSFKMKKHFPQYAPKEGIRYDGIYKVVKYYPEKGKSGFIVWKYLLRRDDPTPAPWEEGALQYPIVYPDGYLEAEAEKNALKEKGNKPKKSSTKRSLKNKSTTSDSEEMSEDENSPPVKKKKTSNTVTPSPQENKVSKKTDTNYKVKIPTMFNFSKKTPKKEDEQDAEIEDFNNVLTSQEIESIKADISNCKLWKECLEVCKTSGKKAFVEKVTEMFLCIICLDVPVNPVTTPCFHNFCMGCISFSFKTNGNKSCPACRGDLSKVDLQMNDKLKIALQTIMPGYDAGRK